MIQNTSAEEVIQVFKHPFKGRREKKNNQVFNKQ